MSLIGDSFAAKNAPRELSSGGQEGEILLLPFLILLLFFAAAAGVVYPYRKGWKRRHFLLATIGTFVGLVLTVPEPTPEERAAWKQERAQREKEEAAEEARAEAKEKRERAAKDHEEVLEKAAPALQALTAYTRAEFRQTYARVGAETFARLTELEPGAVYAAAESTACDRVNTAMVSDTSKPNAAVWFADCANGDRFMIGQKEAEAALARFKAGALALRKLERSCTIDTVAQCKLTPAQRAAKEKEIEYVTACDLILQQVVVSPSSLDMHRWQYGFGKGNRVVIQRPFDSENSFGAMLRGHYRCEIDASNNGIKGFTVYGPAGAQKII